jgi:hypothetical protein
MLAAALNEGNQLSAISRQHDGASCKAELKAHS